MDWQRCETLRRLGHNVIGLDQSGHSQQAERRFLRRLGGHAFRTKPVRDLNAIVMERTHAERPEILWIDKGLLVQKSTLDCLKSDLPRMKIVAYQDDNPFGFRKFERPIWREFIECIPSYDLHFVKRNSDIREFQTRGAKRVEIFVHGFYEPFFEGAPGRPAEGYQRGIAFMGSQLETRGRVITGLLLRHRLDVHVYGRNWGRCLGYYFRRANFHGPYPIENASKLIRQSKINLGFVSKLNKDEYAGRSIEIPAAGGFLLAERTPAHEAFYREGREAEFFSDVPELVAKCNYYLSHERAREEVALAGYSRTRQDDYSLSRRMQDAVTLIAELT